MPLRKGRSRTVMAANLHELEHSRTKAGRRRTHAQNIAIMLRQAGMSKRKRKR